MEPQKLMKAWDIILHKHTDFCERYKESERAFNLFYCVLMTLPCGNKLVLRYFI